MTTPQEGHLPPAKGERPKDERPALWIVGHDADTVWLTTALPAKMSRGWGVTQGFRVYVPRDLVGVLFNLDVEPGDCVAIYWDGSMREEWL